MAKGLKMSIREFIEVVEYNNWIIEICYEDSSITLFFDIDHVEYDENYIIINSDNNILKITTNKLMITQNDDVIEITSNKIKYNFIPFVIS